MTQDSDRFDDQDDKEAVFLQRIIRINDEDNILEYEPDVRRAELIVRELGLQGAKPVATPRVKRKAEEVLAGIACKTRPWPIGPSLRGWAGISLVVQDLSNALSSRRCQRSLLLWSTATRTEMQTLEKVPRAVSGSLGSM